MAYKSLHSTQNSVDFSNRKWYGLSNYTTDGSGIDHRKYKDCSADRLGNDCSECKAFFLIYGKNTTITEKEKRHGNVIN